MENPTKNHTSGAESSRVEAKNAESSHADSKNSNNVDFGSLDSKNADSSRVDSKNTESKPPKLQKVISGAYDLSLGISIVVAILIGFGLGYGLKQISGISWLLWLGIAWGVAAAGLNIYKAYQRQKKDLQELANNPRYTYHANKDDDDENEGKYY